MPCYDPPPPYEGNQRKNTEEAAWILYNMVKQVLVVGIAPPREVLKWFIDHRQIDVESATYWRRTGEIEADKKDIEGAQALIKEST